jgi:choice-of-anchor B domain-containing protein
MFKSRIFLICFFCWNLISAQENYNLTVRGHLTFPGKTLANIGGYADSLGNEYALVGTSTGLAIVDVTNPDNPVLKFNVNGVQNFWREVKTWKGFAYVTTEGANGGLTIVDMRQLPDTIISKVYRGNGVINNTLKTIHSLHIDAGFCYLYGSNLASGGIVMLNLADPWNPVYAGSYSARYVHDGFVAGDTVWACNVNDGVFTAIDVRNKMSPVALVSQETPGNLTHNSWLTDNHNVLLTTDETENSFLCSFDITDLNNITELDRFQTAPGSNSIVHNTHVLNDFAVNSWYTEGVVIVDAARPNNLIEVAKNDFTTYEGAGFYGCWGVYPFLPSGTIVASDIDNGLFVLTPTYVRACYLEGVVTDSICGANLDGVTVTIVEENVVGFTALNGAFYLGTPHPGLYTVSFSKTGYATKTISNVNLSNGMLTEFQVRLRNESVVYYSGTVKDSAEGLPIGDAFISVSNGSNAYQLISNNQGEFGDCDLLAGTYQEVSGKWGFVSECRTGVAISNTTAPAEIILSKKYYDDFQFNFGWTSSSTSLTGNWERAIPASTTFDNQIYNPGSDVALDCNEIAYVTGNTPNSAAGDNDVDDGNTKLSSPVMDLSNYSNPYISYYRWFANGGGAGTPNDTLFIQLMNAGNQPVTVQKIVWNNRPSQWVKEWCRVADYLDQFDQVRFVVQAWDFAPGHLVEAGLDQFEVKDSIDVTGFILPNSQKIEFRVYPNPSTGKASVKFNTAGLDEVYQLRIIDFTGRKLATKIIQTTASDTELPSDFPAGIYLVQLMEKGRVLGTEKWVKF